MWSNRQKMHDADAGRARQHLPEPTGLWRVPDAHVVAVRRSPARPATDRAGGASAIVSIFSPHTKWKEAGLSAPAAAAPADVWLAAGEERPGGAGSEEGVTFSDLLADD